MKNSASAIQPFSFPLLFKPISCKHSFVKTHLFVLGRNPQLSRTELAPLCDEVLYVEEKSLMLAENVKFENPRDLPKSLEQIFLDRLGGTIRMGEVLGEFKNEKEVQDEILKQVQVLKPEGKVQLGISAWGCGKTFLRHFLPETKNAFRDQHDRNCRIVNAPGQNLDSGKIFGEKLLRKGFEFLVWKRENSFLVARTMANQNLRNYVLRDREKDFRDARMGMLPPKVAQILLNLANPEWTDTVIDPFCGSGTLNIEAAITGFKTIGSDLDAKRTQKGKENFDQMAEKFRYETGAGEFFAGDAIQFPLAKAKGVIATEGFLGDVFEKHATDKSISNESQIIVRLWEKLLTHLENSEVHTIVFCLPAWKFQGHTISISEKLFAKIGKSSYIPSALFNGKRTFLYARPDSFVMREICVLQKSK